MKIAACQERLKLPSMWLITTPVSGVDPGQLACIKLAATRRGAGEKIGRDEVQSFMWNVKVLPEWGARWRWSYIVILWALRWGGKQRMITFLFKCTHLWDHETLFLHKLIWHYGTFKLNLESEKSCNITEYCRPYLLFTLHITYE